MPYPSTFDEIVGLATAGMKFKTWPYTFDLLPVNGFTDPISTLGETQMRLRDSLAIVDGMRKGPYGLPVELVQKLENIRFHIVNALFLCDVAQRTGHAWRSPASNIDGLRASIDNQVAAIERARPVWNTWLTSALANKGPNDVLPPPPAVALSYGYGADAPITDSTGGLVKTNTLSDYLAIGVVAGGLLLLVHLAGK